MPLSITVPALAVVLLAASWTDITRNRIPNVLTFVAALVGLSLQGWIHGIAGLASGLGGLGVGLSVLLPFYLLGGMGAGDVKLMAAVGAFLGPKGALAAGAGTLIAGGPMAVAVLLWRGNAGALLRRYGLMTRTLLTTGSAIYLPPEPDEAKGLRFPYALAITLGAVGALWWRSLP